MEETLMKKKRKICRKRMIFLAAFSVNNMLKEDFVYTIFNFTLVKQH